MTSLEQLVPSLALCQQLQKAGFPQDTAMVWTHSVYKGDIVVTRDVYDGSYELDEDDGLELLCAAPTAGEMEEWLFTKGNEMIVGASAGGGFNVNWGINLFIGNGKNLQSAYADVVLQYLAWKKGVAK